ncbi:hypothetical protein Ava_D0011 [Trichormus variabilis ATCC 29413]|uniref:Uncharacterized protein n=2 Tax=Anabaena variabilis TaxID=264691 RepID=Q3M2W0_TRIV2|nr:hypothetical protein [Trichormus variabilis]ABA24676.1 hypothetical protein Ava_D0011 [Trichormus variabilis ATCC 29413]MBC1258998.1 hypothetical protein [Trichormus variabilis V5]MBC1302709.1 hypothetical protein [Trichormus variabilis N2B]MBC1324564.1 hypothetical protein [Trichormus variabilis 9RC]MBC1324622.1 hypothetical protein [Trichormus variabilis 9RC]
MGWLENVVRSQTNALNIADQIVGLFAQQQQQIAIATQVIEQFSQLIGQQEQNLAIADQALDALGPLAVNAVVLGEFSATQDLMIQKFWEILSDPVQCAEWYLQLDPPQQKQLVTPTASVPSAFSRPSFPAPPAPGVGGATNNRDKFRSAWQHNPGMAWQVIDQLASQDIVSLFGQ